MLYACTELSDMVLLLTRFQQFCIVQPKSDQYLTETEAATEKKPVLFYEKR